MTPEQRRQARKLAEAQHLLNTIKSEALYQYRPDTSPGHDQLAFHRSKARIRLMLAGTGAGKTIMTMAEVAAAVTGQSKSLYWIGEPYKPPPVHVWIVKPKFPTNMMTDPVIIKLLKGDEYTDPETGERRFLGPFISPRFTPDYNKKTNVITINNGSTIEIKSHEQDVAQFASAGIDVIVVDEPIREEVWQECFYRVVRRQGSRILFAMTPMDANSSYMYDLMKEKDKSRVEHFRMSTARNLHLGKAELQHVLDATPEHLRDTRIDGLPASMSGLVYKWNNWITPFTIPKDWTRYVVHDPGMDDPAATLWCAIDPEHNIYLYKCVYNESRTHNLRIIANEILEMNDGDEIREWYCDPFAGAWRIPTISDQTEEVETRLTLYQECGIPFIPGPKEMDQAGIIQRVETTRCYIDEQNKRFPNIYAFDMPEMDPLRKELSLYRMAQSKSREDKNNPNKPHHHHNHLMYCMETMCSLRLRYYPSRHTPRKIENDNDWQKERTMRAFDHAEKI